MKIYLFKRPDKLILAKIEEFTNWLANHENETTHIKLCYMRAITRLWKLYSLYRKKK